MGLFDKATTFFGGHGCKVEVTELEKQHPGSVSFPLTDSVVKGRFRVTASKPCTVLAHLIQICVTKKHPDGREEEVVMAEEKYDAANEVIGSDFKFPYQLAAGQSQDDSFCAVNVDIPETLKGLGFADAAASVDSTQLKFFVRVTADVKGTPLDADAIVPFKVTA